MSKRALSDQINDDLSFELKFYTEIAGSDNFDVIPDTYEDGYRITAEDYEDVMKETKKTGVIVLFRIQYKDRAVVINSRTGKTGIAPVDNVDGFIC